MLDDHDIENASRLVEFQLMLWGKSQRGEYSLLGYRDRTREYDLMCGKLCGIYQSSTAGYQYVDVEVMDTDRCISALPDHLRRVLYVEYILGGTVKKRVKVAGASKTTYYRNLLKAKQALAVILMDEQSNDVDGAEVAQWDKTATLQIS